MKICIPTQDANGLDSMIESHFGRADYFTFVETDTNQVNSMENRGSHKGGNRTPAEIIADEKPQVVICGGMGPRAIQIFESKQISVYNGASGSIKKILDDFQAGRIQRASGDTACQEHEHTC